QKYNAPQLVLSRSIVSFAISAFIIKRRKLPFFGVNKKWLLVRGIAGVIALTIFFFTLVRLPLAIAAVIQYLSPIFTVILAIFILKDKIHKMQWVFILMAFIGVTLLTFYRMDEDLNEIGLNGFWLGMGMISAFFSSLAYIAIVKLKPTDEPITIVLYFPMLAFPIMGVWCYFDSVMPEGVEWILLLLVGIFTQMAQILMTKSLHFGQTSIIVPFQYFGAIYAFLIGFFVFDERLNLILYFGLAIIILSVVGNTLYRHYSEKAQLKLKLK
ncbi:MAG: DMT family transporter, partial [Bacteroidetes bacterium]|nr:DMT family transporter [Bacteroidota bacterium]